MTLAEAVRKLLKERGMCSKIGVVEEKPGCTLLYCDGGDGVLIAVSEHDGWVYVKMVAEGSVKPYMWHCDELLYTPYGVYAFARGVDELVSKLVSKKRLVLGQLRLALERLADIEE